MFDIAYEPECTFAAVDLEWNRIMKVDCSRPIMESIPLLWYVPRLDFLKIYWSIMFGTHGV